MPSDAEWITLQTYLIANGYNYDGSTTSNYIAKSMASVTGWKTYSSTGTIGNNPSTNNTSGFTALPGGYRNDSGEFYAIGSNGYWWSSTQDDASNTFGRGLHYDNSYLGHVSSFKVNGFSVRCIKD